MKRKQFTFYSSFAEAVLMISDPEAQRQALWEIIKFGLNGEEPDIEELPEGARIVMSMVKPVLDAARRKAASGQKGGCVKQTESKNKNKDKDKIKDKDKLKTKTKGNDEAAGDAAGEARVSVCRDYLFSDFWEAYPVKLDRKNAEEAWKSLSPDQDTFDELMENLRLWKKSARWANEGGRYIPNPAAFLDKGYWRNAPPVSTGGPYRGEIKASGTLGEAEKENIRRILMT